MYKLSGLYSNTLIITNVTAHNIPKIAKLILLSEMNTNKKFNLCFKKFLFTYCLNPLIKKPSSILKYYQKQLSNISEQLFFTIIHDFSGSYLI